MAPKSLPREAFVGWIGHVVVLRAHTHDPEAAGCTEADRAKCEQALVVESIVWPSIPDSINGEHVHQGAELLDGSLEKLSGDFLVGGLARMDRANPLKECASSAAARKLAISCESPYTTVGTVWLAPISSAHPTNGYVVVVRAHMDQATAAACPSLLKYQCEQVVIADSVVWSSNPYGSNGATPSP